MEAILTLIGTIIVAIISLIGVIFQTKSKEKQDSIDKKLDAFRKESKDDDIKLNKKLDDNHLQTLKLWLVTEMTKIREGNYKPNDELRSLIHEAKQEYNNLGGDSYVDSMFDELKDKKLI